MTPEVKIRSTEGARAYLEAHTRIHATALIGDPPEHREWSPGDPHYAPVIGVEAKLNAYVTIDAGIKRSTVVGARALLMKHVHVGHDAIVGDDCELAPGVVICGHVELGAKVRVGVNACVRPFVKVGAGARIGCGAVVTKDVPAGEVWVGNPARNIADRRANQSTLEELVELVAGEIGRRL